MRIPKFLLVALVAIAWAGCGGEPSAGSAEKEIKTFADLAGKKIGVKAGTMPGLLLPKKVRDPQIKEYSVQADLFLALQNGSIDAVSIDLPHVLAFLKKFSGYSVLDERLDFDHYGIALQKDSPYKAEIDSVLSVLKGEGFLENLSRQWLEVDIDESPAAPEQEWPGKNGTWVVATSGTSPPFDYYKNNKLAGYSIALITEIAKRLDRKLEFTTMDFASFIPALVSQKVDMCISDISITEERQKLVNFSQSIYDNESVVVVKKTHVETDDADEPTRGPSGKRFAKVLPVKKQIATFADLEGMKIGVKTGSVHDMLVSNKIKSVEKKYFVSAPDMLLALKKGTVDAIAYDEPAAAPWIKKEPGLLMKLDEVLDRDSYGIALSKNSPYTKKIDDALQTVMDEGLLQKALDKWLDYGDDTETIPMDWPGKNGSLTVATNGSLPPFCFFKNYKLAGFEIDLMLEIAKKLDMHVKFVAMDFSGILPSLASKKVDVAITGISITEERRKLIDFTRPYYQNSAIVIVRREKPANYNKTVADGMANDFAKLEGQRIGVLTGSSYDKLVHDAIKNAECKYYSNFSDMYLALKTGAIKAIASDEIPARKLQKSDSLVRILDTHLAEESYGIVFQKNSPYRAKVDSALQLLLEKGAFRKFLRKWDDSVAAAKTIPVDWDGSNGKLVVACEAMFPPFIFYKDNKLVGSEVDLALAIGKILNMEVEFFVMNFDAIIPSIVAQKADMGIAAFGINDERAQMVDFSIPYYKSLNVVAVYSQKSEAAGAEVLSSLKASFYRTFIHEERWKMVLGGLWITIYISIFSGIFGILLGFAICMVRRSKMAPLAVSSACFIRCIQGTPVLVLLMILYYIVFGHSGLSGEVVAIIAFSINFGAYASEIIRSGMNSVDVGQLEASAALGYNNRQTFFKILLPQAAQRFIPVLKGEFISMVKMTSIVGYVAVMDLTKVSDIIRSRTMEAFFPLIATAVLYFVIASALTGALSYCEKKTNPKRRLRKINGVDTDD